MTDKDKKSIYEFCGFRFKLSASENPHYWIDPDGLAINALPSLNMENLFQYAMPKLKDYFRKVSNPPYNLYEMLSDWIYDVIMTDIDPAEAFGQALIKLIREEK